MAYRIQSFNAYLIFPILRLTGFRFSKDYRYGTTAYHRAVYSLIDTVKANNLCD